MAPDVPLSGIQAAATASLRSVWRALLLVAALPLAVSCGGGGDGAAIVARAQTGLRHLERPVRLHLSVETPIPVDRTFSVRPAELPKLRLTRWAKHPQRVACRLECARADVDIEAALRDLGPLLPSLPVDPKDVRSATLDVAVEKNGRPRYLHISGKVHVTLLGDVPFKVNLEVPARTK